MASGYTMSSIDRDSCKITVGGKTYTMAEYRKLLKEKKEAANGNKKKRRKSKKEVKEITGVALQVEKMLKPITTLKSLSAYYDNAYKQWGTIATEILEHPKIRPHFVY